ncbi:hypothetical protein [Microcystis sp. M061S2]|uniref:hypothetical protein n=1 Tax=Microcystis sp. M061S2 TaxID=2771171 RepID=UPI00258B25E3|nr:hypothetical protein [Microcystis sp. M061S2]MCA2656116.1 hypothetical protein [Microcystis sp. M061S2]MCA6481156.1 hypothetical protein [Chitinophagaceae bacterium]
MPKPKILKRLEYQLSQKGYSEEAATKIAVAGLQKSGNLKPGSTEPTAKGVKRGNMTASERAKDRAAKKTGRSASEYKYNQLNNTARLKK